MDDSTLRTLALVAAATLGVLLLAREFWTWFFKLNGLERIEGLLRQIRDRLPEQQEHASPPEPEPTTRMGKFRKNLKEKMERFEG